MSSRTQRGMVRALQTRSSRELVLPLLMVAVLLSTAGPAHAAGQIAPVLECVAVNTDGSFTAVFGTDNQTGQDVMIPVGRRTNGKWSNTFSPTADIGQPTQIAAGRHVGVFSATSTHGGVLQWRLGDRQVTANRNATPCSDQPAVPDVPDAALAGLAALLGAAWGVRHTRTAAAESAG